MLVSKDESLTESMPHVGYLVLRYVEKQPNKQATLSEIARYLRDYDVSSYRSLIFGLTFLHCVGVIAFEAPFFYLTK